MSQIELLNAKVMSQPSEKPEFSDYAKRIRARYKGIVDLESDRYRDLIPDFYEAWEDLEVIHPILTSIVLTNLSNEQFRNALKKLESRLWHVIGHLGGIKEALETLDTGSDETSHHD